MANVSFADAQGVHQFKYVDHSNFYTYKLAVGKQDSEMTNWVLNCTVEITSPVKDVKDAKDDEEESESADSGMTAVVRFGSMGTFSTYIPNASWKSVDEFRAALRRKCPNMQAVFCTMTQAELQKYGNDQMQAFRDGSYGGGSKKLVTRLGRQADGKTIVFGPLLAFVETEDTVNVVDTKSTDYAWVPGLLRQITIANNTTNPDHHFRDVARLFQDETLYSFVLTLGGFYMGMHYDKVIQLFNRCPVVVCVGDTNCGKSLALAKSAGFVGTNAASVLERKSVTAAAARETCSQQTFPMMWHDPSLYAIETLKTLIEETYEGKAVTTSVNSLVPHTSLMFTCNKDVLKLLLDQLRALSRCVLLPFLLQYREPGAREKLNNARQTACNKESVAKLLRMNERDLQDVAETVDEVNDEIEKTLIGYGLTESASRISFNIAMVFAFGIRAVDILDVQSDVDVRKVRQYAVKDVAKFAATWQKTMDGKRKQPDPPVPLSPAKRLAAAKNLPSLNEMMNGTIVALGEENVRKPSETHPEQVKEVMRTTVRGDKTKCVAFKKDRTIDIMQSKGLDYSFLDRLRQTVDQVPNVELSVDVRFSCDKTTVKAVRFPAAEVSERIVGLLNGSKCYQDYITERRLTIWALRSTRKRPLFTRVSADAAVFALRFCEVDILFVFYHPFSALHDSRRARHSHQESPERIRNASLSSL